jgi:glycerophosphoryl diester phosphodiesterase
MYNAVCFRCSNVRENTIASMRDALLHGADMVEFDVQVCQCRSTANLNSTV